MDSSPGAESHAVRGAVDRGALRDFRDAFERHEPLADGRLDDPVDPRTLLIDLDDGVGIADRSHLDVVWTTEDDYAVHYTDADGRNLRWDRHVHDYPAPAGDRHFHPPPDATSDPRDVEPSCVTVDEIALVAMATAQLWRRAIERGSFAGINDARDPP